MTKTFCDKCEKELTGVFELEERRTISFRGGYTSVFGDGANVHIEICQDCLFTMLNDAGLINEQTVKEERNWFGEKEEEILKKSWEKGGVD